MVTIQLRRGTSAQWIAANPILANGEVGIELGPGIIPDKGKIGDGVTNWIGLPYSIDSAWIPLAEKGVAGGVATLDVTGVVPLAQIPGGAAIDAEVAAAIDAHEVDPAGHIGTYVRVNEGPLSLLDSRVNADPTGVIPIHPAMLAAYALLPNGGEIFGPPGVYNQDVGEVPPSGITVDGSGPGTKVSPTTTTAGKATQFRASAAIPVMWDLANTAGTKLKNIGIDGRDSALTLVRVTGYQNEVRDCDIQRGTTYGLLLPHLAVNNHENNIKDNVVLMNKMGTCLRVGDDLAMAGGANDNEISGNTFRGGLRIVHLYNSAAQRLLGNHFYAYPTAAGDATESILIEGSHEILIGAGNQFDLDAGGPAVRIKTIDATHWCYDIDILGNHFLGAAAVVDNTESPFVLDASAANSRIDRVQIAANILAYDAAHRPKYFIDQTGTFITNINFDLNTCSVEPATARFAVQPDTAVGNGIGIASQQSIFTSKDSAGGTTPVVSRRAAGQFAGFLFDAQTDTGTRLGGIDARGASRAPGGDALTAGHSFADESGMGLYRIGAGILGVAVAAAEVLRLSATGLTLLADKVFTPGRNTTANRPSAATAGQAALFFDTTLNKPVWSDGTNWRETSPAYGARPTAAIRESIPRPFAAGDQAALTSAQLYVVALYLEAGVPVTSITFVSSTTPASVPLNQWFGIFDKTTRAPLRLTADDTTTAWASNSRKTLALSSSYTPTYSGFYDIGIMVKATTPPTLRGVNMGQVLSNDPPVTAGTSTGSLTDPASCPNPIAALSVASTMAYCYVS